MVLLSSTMTKTYNNMATAMSTLHSKLFLKSHKSYFTEDDLNILDEYCTKPIVGLCPVINGSIAPAIGDTDDNIIEIDIRRA